MKKIDILKKIEEQVARGILNPNSGEPVGLKITKQNLKKSKEENEDYYKELEKKFRDYLKLDTKDNPSPKVNMTDKDHEMYYGTGMEGLKYDDEDTEKYKKFVERNKKLNEPSKDYYLKKDQVEDSFGKITKDGEHYKKHKYGKPDEYQKTPKVRITNENHNKNTMKRLTYKKPFLSHDKTMNLIPEGYKQDGNKFQMTDGVETYTIKWEGTNTTGTPTVLSYKNEKLVKEDITKMEYLYDYNSSDLLMKTNDALTENTIFNEMLNKTRSLLKEQEATATPATPEAKPQVGTDKKVDPNAIQQKSFLGKIGDENKEVTFIVKYKRNGVKYEVVETQFLVDGKTYSNPNDTNVTELTKVNLIPSSKSTPKYESMYTLVNRALSDKDIKTFVDPKKLLTSASEASKVLYHKYNEPTKAKSQKIEDAVVMFYPYNVVDQIGNKKEACKLPNFAISFNNKITGVYKLTLDNVVKAGKEIAAMNADSTFAISAKNKSNELFEKIKQVGATTCTA